MWNFLRGLLGNPAAVIDYVREASERLREQLPAGQQALAEKKQALMDVKARLARYHERFERAPNAGEEDLAWERIKQLREQENALKAEIAKLEAQQSPHGDRQLDARPRPALSPDARALFPLTPPLRGARKEHGKAEEERWVSNPNGKNTENDEGASGSALANPLFSFGCGGWI